MKIGIIGLGNMGKSLYRLFVRNKFEMNVTLSDRNKENTVEGYFAASINENIENSEILFICVKPKDIDQVLKNFENAKNKTIVSCVAGVTLEDIKKQIKNDLQVVRMMPNLPIEYKSGTISYFFKNINKRTEERILELCKGPKSLKLNEEKLLDIATILSGSMPGFSAYLAEEYINFGIKNGLTEKESLDLYTSSIEGTLKMLKDYSSKEIINKVSSPKGITMKGIQYLEYSDVQKNIKNSLEFCLENISKLKS